MKKLNLLSILLILSTNLMAKCGGPDLYFFPVGGEINENAIFMVEGYLYENIIEGLNKKYPIYLRSGDLKVKLEIFQKQIGQFGLSQVLLKPVELLKPDREYEIVIEDFPIGDPLIKKKTQTFKKWKVKLGKDIEAPKFKENPTEVAKVSVMYGCGPEIQVRFNCKVSEKSEYLVKTKVKNTKTGVVRIYYLTAQNDVVEVGHGMCAGAFILEDEADYEVAFSLIDASGNENLTGEKTVKFKAPKAVD